MSCNRKVVSICTPIEEIINNGMGKAGLMFDDQVANEFWPNFMHYSVTVKKGTILKSNYPNNRGLLQKASSAF